jgi:hypothetical protein
MNKANTSMPGPADLQSQNPGGVTRWELQVNCGWDFFEDA